ncbi:MAG TPA: hypothetical protein VFF81_01740 [Noviherbaspirillum sp.]|nr:hypothetical protein [Noviherbaspirillum sp.]
MTEKKHEPRINVEESMVWVRMPRVVLEALERIAAQEGGSISPHSMQVLERVVREQRERWMRRYEVPEFTLRTDKFSKRKVHKGL